MGASYRLTPENVNFAQPVTLRFTYSNDEAAANVPERMRIVSRNAAGRWVVLPATRDAAARTLSVNVTHFSDWSHVGGLQLAPASAVVEVNRQIAVRVIDCGDAPDPENGQEAVLRECQTSIAGNDPSGWTVNGVANGNASVGTLTTIPGVGRVAGYRAPASVPAQNPVAVSAQFNDGQAHVSLVSNIRVVDQIDTYVGNYSGTTRGSGNGVSGESEIHASVRFKLAQVDESGMRTYLGSGRARMAGWFKNGDVRCDWAPATGDLHVATGLNVAVGGQGSLANRYSIGLLGHRSWSASTTRPCGPRWTSRCSSIRRWIERIGANLNSWRFGPEQALRASGEDRGPAPCQAPGAAFAVVARCAGLRG